MFHQELCDGGIPRPWAAFLEIFVNALKSRLNVADHHPARGLDLSDANILFGRIGDPVSAHAGEVTKCRPDP